MRSGQLYAEWAISRNSTNVNQATGLIRGMMFVTPIEGIRDTSADPPETVRRRCRSPASEFKGSQSDQGLQRYRAKIRVAEPVAVNPIPPNKPIEPFPIVFIDQGVQGDASLFALQRQLKEGVSEL